MEFKKSITKSFDISCVIKWECPHCGYKKNETSFTPSPYTILADDAPDDNCIECNEPVSLNFHKNKK